MRAVFLLGFLFFACFGTKSYDCDNPNVDCTGGGSNTSSDQEPSSSPTAEPSGDSEPSEPESSEPSEPESSEPSEPDSWEPSEPSSSGECTDGSTQECYECFTEEYPEGAEIYYSIVINECYCGSDCYDACSDFCSSGDGSNIDSACESCFNGVGTDPNSDCNLEFGAQCGSSQDCIDYYYALQECE